MDEVIGFLNTLGKIASVFVAIGALAAFVFKERIKHFFASDLEGQRATLMRELEAYKVSLIAEAERMRATQDVKKAAALRLLDRRLDVLVGVTNAHLGIDTDIAGFCVRDFPDDASFFRERTELHARLDACSKACSAASLHLESPFRSQLIDVRKRLIDLLATRVSRAHALQSEDPRIREAFGASSSLEEELRRLFRELERAHAV